MKSILLIVLIPILFISCNNSKENNDEQQEKNVKFYLAENTHNNFTGDVVDYYSNGQIKTKQSYKDGQKHGKYSYWFKDGNKKAEGIFSSGKRQGTWKWWHNNDDRYYEINYEIKLKL